MKIILIRHLDLENVNTRVPESLIKIMGYVPPLGILYIAAVLEKNGYEVKVVDSQVLNFDSELLKRELYKEKPDIVGITTMTPTIKGALEAAKIAKEVGAITVLGGSHLSVCPKETLSYDYVDYGIIGEGEIPMLELVKAIENNKNVYDVKGLIYRNGTEIIVNEPYINNIIDDIPFPSRHLVPIEKYSSVIALHPMTTVLTGRGCVFKCGFCFKQPSDNKLRLRNVKSLVDEIELCIKKYKVKEIMLIDDTFTCNKEYVKNFCEEIINRNLVIKWEATTRVDVVNDNLLQLMHKAGCIRLRYGIESGDENILKIMRKKIDLKMAKQIFKATKKVGIETFAYFIIGYYSETKETIKRTINFAKKLNPDMIMFLQAVPLPKTNLFELAVKENLVNYDYWEKYTLGIQQNPIKPFVENVEKYVKKAYFSFYIRPMYIIKNIFKIKSFDMLKKYFLAFIGLIFFKMRKKEINKK